MITYFYWWYFEEPQILLNVIRAATKKTFLSFSVPTLLRTIFDPWKRDLYRAENASLQAMFNIWLNNIISRLVGFVMRIFTIFAGLLSTLFVFLISLSVFII